jgi:hypothetical protein
MAKVTYKLPKTVARVRRSLTPPSVPLLGKVRLKNCVVERDGEQIEASGIWELLGYGLRGNQRVAYVECDGMRLAVPPHAIELVR